MTYLLKASLIITLGFIWADGCGQNARVTDYLPHITEEKLSGRLHFIAADFFQGRKVGSIHEYMTASYLASEYSVLGIPPKGSSSGQGLEEYFQPFHFSLTNTSGNSQNVLAYIEGSDPVLKNQVIILTAHYDHLGIVANGEAGDSILNGAADDASGTVALLAIAETFKDAMTEGVKFKRSFMFVHMGGEESGLLGSHHYVKKDPVIPLESTFAIINLDGVGGTDRPGKSEADNYVYVLSNDSTSQAIRKITMAANKQNRIDLEILSPQHPENFTSDDIPFLYELVPSIYFSTGLTEHYHLVSDEAHTLNYTHMLKIVKLVFSVAWELANTSQVESIRQDFVKTGKYFCRPCGCGEDGKLFDSPGICSSCKMPLEPNWTRK